MPDDFTKESFWADFCALSNGQSQAQTLLPYERVSVYDEIDSTNSELLRRLEKSGRLRDDAGALTKDGCTLHLELAASATQSAGRGRMGRSFYSPTKTGIYFSFIYAPVGGVKDPAVYTITSVVGVCRAIEALYGVHCGIKWVNDVYLNGKKVCGILTEGFSNHVTQTVEAAVVGIGINMSCNSGLPPEIAAKAGGIADESLRLGCPKERVAGITRSWLLAACMKEILAALCRSDGCRISGDVLADYRRHSILNGRRVLVTPLIGESRGNYPATVVGISDDIGLIVETEDGEQRELKSGEVTLTGTQLESSGR